MQMIFQRHSVIRKSFSNFWMGLSGQNGRNISTNTVLVIAGEEEPDLREDKGHGRERGNHKDTMKNSGLFLCLGSTYYPVGQTTMKSMRAGPGLQVLRYWIAEGEISPGIK